jgi:RimJ/RimL family protein N-acetyltransferase
MMQDFSLEHLVLTDGNIVIRSAHPSDEKLLTQWFTDPDVYAYWGGRPPSPEEIAAHCQVEISDDTCWPFIILDGTEPAGFIQAWLRDDMTGGLDLFIAPQSRRKGIALRALLVLAKHLRDAMAWKRITVDPSVENAAAIALYERAGFADTGVRFTEENALHMLMEFR